MPEKAVDIADLFHIRSRFLRSVHLERDFRDPAALDGYVVTEHAATHLRRIAGGLSPTSGHRAWRITGDYGVGKSSLALLLAHMLAGGAKGARRLDGRPADVVLPKTKLLPILITGARERAASSVLTSVLRTIETLRRSKERSRLTGRIRRMLAQPESLSDGASVVAIEDAAKFVRSGRHADGLLLVLDELGKFLEHAAVRPDQQDVYFLQQLGESASRSGKIPIIVVGLLHQGFGAYADRLSESSQREWQKVAGRFEELLFERPLFETAKLVADALGVDQESLPSSIRRQARAAMATASDLGWYGRLDNSDARSIADRLYPLHATSLPVLAKLMARFGQNERSLFSFLLSSEPHGLQAFAQRRVSASEFYRIHNLYNYARATLGQYLRVQSYRSHWNLLESVVESFPAEHEIEVRVLKTVAILNLLDDQCLPATTSTLKAALWDAEHGDSAVAQVISQLHKKRVLYRRGASGTFCLWPHTSVNIERAYEEAQRAVTRVGSVASVIARAVDTRPVVARRHYIETGNLRHFEVRCPSCHELEEPPSTTAATNADGLILIPLCETEHDRAKALQFACAKELRARPEVFVAVPKPLEMLRSMALEAARWHWVAENTPELAQDKYAWEEVSRQVEASREILRNRIRDLVGLRTLSEKSEMQWFRASREMTVSSSRDLLSRLSCVCDKVFASAPTVRNELLNRRRLSSAAAAARMRLIERLLLSSSEPLLGLDPHKAPPEMSMYLSVLRRGHMHVKRKGVYTLTEPAPDDDPLRVLPTFSRMRELLQSEPDARVPVSLLRDELARAPFGVREGLFSLLLAIFVVVHESEVAAYEDGAFVPKLDGGGFMRLTKDAASFELQYCRITGVRASVFAQLARALQLQIPQDRVVEVVRSLCVFAAQLPQHTHTTRRLSREALNIRSTLISAREPGLLLFQDLPAACGVEPFKADARGDEGSVLEFVTTLKAGLDELRQHYGALLDGLRVQLQTCFEASGTTHSRVHLAHTASAILPSVNEQRLRGFCIRLSDQALPEVEWLEALAAYVVGKRPADWRDSDVDRFPHELERLAHHFRRVEAAAFERNSVSGTFAARLSVTVHDGSDVARVVHLSAEDEPLARQLESEILAVIARSRRVGLAATSRVLLKELGTPAQDDNSESPEARRRH